MEIKNIEDVMKFKFRACNPPGCGCPEVEYDNGSVTIQDDFGGSAKLTLQELEFIVKKTHNIIANVKADLESQATDFAAQQEAVLRRKQEILESQLKK